MKYRIIEKDCTDLWGNKDRKFFIQKRFLFIWLDQNSGAYELEEAKQSLDYFVRVDKLNSTKTPSVVHEEI